MPFSKYSSKQKKLAAVAKPRNKITGADLKKLRKKNKDTMIFNKTGLLIDSYFSGTKIKWILDNVSKARQLLNKKQ